MSKVQEIEARCVDKVFNSKEKADNYVREQEKRENLPNLSGFDRTVEEWELSDHGLMMLLSLVDL